MARKQGAMVMMVLMWLFPLVYGTDLQCVYCPGLFGVYSCTRINNTPITTCVRIKPMAKEPIREIRLFSCAVRIVVGWDGQQQPFMIRDRDGNICNREYFFNIPPSYLCSLHENFYRAHARIPHTQKLFAANNEACNFHKPVLKFTKQRAPGWWVFVKTAYESEVVRHRGKKTNHATKVGQ